MTPPTTHRASVPPPPAESFDLVVLGGGPAGEQAARTAAARGHRVAMVERAARAEQGAASLLPIEVLREAAILLGGPRLRALEPGRDRGAQRALLELLRTRSAEAASTHVARVRGELEALSVRLYEGDGRFEDAHTLHVRSGDRTHLLKARNFLVCTGSQPLRPRLVPFESSRVHDARGVVALDEVPPTLVVLGAGVRGLEFACAFAALGSKVTLVDARARVLPFADAEAVEHLLAALARLGITFIPAMRWGAIHAFDDLVTVELADGRVLDTDHLLFAAGRTGRSSDLGLERIGIMPDGRGYLPVDDAYRTEVPHIFAAGDVIGPPSFASTAREQGRHAVAHAFGLPRPSARPLPHCVYAIPELSGVGETEASAKAKGLDVVVGRGAHVRTVRGLVSGDVEGLTKLVVERSSGRLLGVHVVGDGASELVHVGQALMACGASVELLTDLPLNQPTLAESYQAAAEDALGSR